MSLTARSSWSGQGELWCAPGRAIPQARSSSRSRSRFAVMAGVGLAEPGPSHQLWGRMTSYRPDPKILTLGPDFYDPVEPAKFPKCVSRFVNERAAESVGLDLDPQGWERHFCRFEPLAGNLMQPLALR